MMRNVLLRVRLRPLEQTGLDSRRGERAGDRSRVPTRDGAGAQRKHQHSDHRHDGASAALAPEGIRAVLSAPVSGAPERALANVARVAACVSSHRSPLSAPRRGPHEIDQRTPRAPGWWNRADRMRVNRRVPPPFGLRPRKFPRTRDLRARVRSAADERPPRRGVVRRARGVQALADRRHGRRHDPAGEAALEARSGRDRRARSAAAGRRCRRLGDERQDDHDRDGGGDPRAAAEARLEPVRRQPRLGRRLDPARRARRRAGAARGGRGRPAGGRPPRPAAGGAARQPLPRPARPLRRARAHRRALAGRDRGAARRDGARRQRRRPAGGRPRPRARERGRLRDRRPAARAAGAPARGRLALLRPLRAAVRVRRGVRRPPRRLPLPGVRARPAAAAGARDGDRARRPRTRPRSCSRRPPARPGSGSRSPASTTSTTRSAPQRSRRRSARRSRRSAPASSASAPRSAASSGSRPATRPCSCS